MTLSFSLPTFFIIFRETTEAAIIVSVLLSFLSQVLTEPKDQALRQRLSRQVWAGTVLGLVVSLIIGAGYIVVWNLYATNLWAASEGIWVGCFSFVAVLMITVMGLAMLRTNQMQAKWKTKLFKALDEDNHNQIANSNSKSAGRFAHQSRKYALFLLPLVTVLREGLEAVVFIGGVTFNEEWEAMPLAIVAGVALGWLVGFAIYRGGNKMRLHRFFVGSTCLLLLIAAGLVAKGIAAFESDRWNRLTDAQGDDDGSYDPRVNLWALTCCDPKKPDAGWWGVANALVGWSNIASYWTVGSYIMYWGLLSAWLFRLDAKRQTKGATVSGEQRPLLQGEGAAAAASGSGEGSSTSRSEDLDITVA
ncbi:hypothetical protein BGZ96_006354 [Linnemannia gamsii]|uniref:Iron permease FTR1 n=1 Tax=Linnemannia gamsii TaxID=64522 RepID=A0ABQ7K345_9FUNG|nr:hypothetical protein BGZ96_006354 [Linnemannia gamsii]